MRYKHRPQTQFPSWGVTGWHSALGLQLLDLRQPSTFCALKRYKLCISHFSLSGPPSLSIVSLKTHLEARMHPPFSPSIHCTGQSPTTVKGLLSAGTAQALELREWILSYQYSHDLVILRHEWMLLGLFCINFPQLDSLAPSGSRLSQLQKGRNQTRPPFLSRIPLDTWGTALPRLHSATTAYLSPASSLFSCLLYPEAFVGQPVHLQKRLHTPPHSSCPGRILCLWKVSQ